MPQNSTFLLLHLPVTFGIYKWIDLESTVKADRENVEQQLKEGGLIIIFLFVLNKILVKDYPSFLSVMSL